MLRLRHVWKPALAVSAPVLGYYWYINREQSFDLPVRVRGPDGKPEMSVRTFPLLSMKAVDARIRENESSHTVSRPNILWNHTTATLAANDPLEDANAHQIIQRDATDPAAPGDLLFFTVMDGHGGHHTSQLLSRVLINAVVHQLSTINAPSPPASSGILSSLKSALSFTANPSTNPSTPADADPARFANAIQTAFTSLDKELINAPLSILAAALAENKADTLPDLTKHPLALPTMLPAVSGSCALMAVLDTAHCNLYVACAGDSRAVAGIWEPAAPGESDGHWRVEVLTEDQTGRNPAEAARIRSEHPASEAADVIRNGRILGGLEPARAFGDARYKWTRDAQEVLGRVFLAGSMRPPPSAFKTPPYVTARPVVTHRRLDLPGPDATQTPTSNPDARAALRFLVLATDGLWDELSSEDVVRLVGGHLAGLRGAVPKSTLATLVPTTSGSRAVEGKAARRARGQEKEAEAQWAFVDATPSAHLIRNAFGGADEGALRRLLSIPAPLARRHRDDVTVTVVWWEDKGAGGGNDANVSTVVVGKGEARAKL